jgi:two-component system chemotaxis response regulator CheY
LTYVVAQVTFAISPLIRGKISLARKILLADDSVTAQNMGRKILADAGYEVITVNNGSAALKKIAELKPDLVILDVYMPGYSGLEVCQRLKESQESARIPVLLTVGKLEPFKPEEAQRVRAEGFIVKPFEASELLSTLSKLEDKVVPRAEPSKPGRFARAIAAVEDAGRGSKGEASGEDNGWKSRISFPHQKAESEEKDKDKDADAAAFYNPINRDLRTVVESPAELAAGKAAKEEEKLHQAHTASEPSVDVAALVPPGLPQDVTPEEVAAIAAAAAQIQMLGAVVKDNLKPAPERVEEKREPIPVQPGVADSAPAASAETAQESPKSENTRERENGRNGKSSEDSRDLPVTMAAAAEAPGTANENGSRWTAVPIALEGAEATVSLDQEMQKAYAAFVAEETASAVPLPEPPSQNSSVPAEPSFPVVPVANPESGFAAQSQPAISAEVVPTEPAVTPPVDSASSSVSDKSLPETELVASVLAQPPLRETPSEAAHFEDAHSDPVPLAEPAPAGQEPAADPVSSLVETAVAHLATPAPQESQPAPDAESTVPEPAAPSHAFASSTPSPHAEHNQEYKEVHHEESETVKSTAAAWANWRQIRDAGETRAGAPESSHPESEESQPVSAETVAMAVAAGAEHAAQENSAPASENPADIAGIVDSVLADLRPRLMAEISRKMSEKK